VTDTAPLTRVLEQAVPAATILADATTIIGEAPVAGVVSSVVYAAAANITGAASPASRTFSLVNKGLDGNGTTVVATLAMVSAVNAADFDDKAITLSVVANATTVAAGDVLAWTSVAVGGTGLVDPGGLVKVTITRS
jgi:hypothetical protein